MLSRLWRWYENSETTRSLVDWALRIGGAVSTLLSPWIAKWVSAQDAVMYGVAFALVGCMVFTLGMTGLFRRRASPVAQRAEEAQQTGQQAGKGHDTGNGADPMPAEKAATLFEPQEKDEAIKQMRAAAYMWEYRYLNHYFVYGTQSLLDWINTNKIVRIEVFHAVWATVIEPGELRARLDALREHNLAIMNASGSEIRITPKGQEYIVFRGPLDEMPDFRLPPAPSPTPAPDQTFTGKLSP